MTVGKMCGMMFPTPGILNQKVLCSENRVVQNTRDFEFREQIVAIVNVLNYEVCTKFLKSGP